MDELLPQCGADVKKCLEMVIDDKEVEAFTNATKKVMLSALKAVINFGSAFKPSDDDPKILSQPQPKKDEKPEITQTSKPSKDETTSSGVPKNPESQTICPTHYKKPCRKKGCKFQHPPWCQNAMEHGLKQFHEKGCDKAVCKNFHPFFCRRSLKTNQCFNLKCKAMHLKGTQRKRHPQIGRAHV